MTAPLRAVVVHRNQPERLRGTVDALRAQGVALDIVVVDNASTADARAAIGSIAGVRVVDAGANLGFGGGANVALAAWLDEPAAAAGHWCLVLPHDARPAPGCLSTMLAAVEREPLAGLVSAEYGDDEVPVVDPYFGAMTMPAPRGSGFQAADYAHGTFLLLRRACLDDVGLFDASYFAYCEEADLSLRAAKAGWRSAIVWGAVVANPHQSTPVPAIDYLMTRNTVVLVRRHFGAYHALVRAVILALSTPWHALRPGGRRSPWFHPRARVLALRDVVLGRHGPPPASLLPR